MSTVKTKKVQLGTDATASNNFTIYQPATPDGTVRIGNGNADAVTDAVTINSSGAVTFANNLSVTGTITGDGSGLTGAGNLLQMQYTTSDTRSSYSLSGSTVYTISELDLTITPTSSSSKIILNYNIFMEADNDIIYRIYRNGTQIGQNSASTDVWSGIAAQTNDEGLNNTPHMLNIHYVDSPASTSAQAYTLRMVSTNGLSWSFYINRSKNNTGAGSTEIGRSTVYALEVA